MHRTACAVLAQEDPGLSGHVLRYGKQPEMNVSEGLNHSCEGCGWGLEGENSPPKLLVCIEVSTQADGTPGGSGKKNTQFWILTPGEEQESLPSHRHQCCGLNKMLQFPKKRSSRNAAGPQVAAVGSGL